MTMDEDVREALDRINSKLNEISVRLTKIETILDAGNFELRLRKIETELATLRGHRAILTVVASVALSAAMTLLIKVLA
jgi:DNA repair exonuclease SbcCD ATPase subunit